jgi:hypothetical protein
MEPYKPNTRIKNPNYEYSIVTVPRTGSHYLQDRIEQHTGVYVRKYHDLQDNKMITIVRDPVDFLSSYVAMESLYYEGRLDKFLADPDKYCFGDWFAQDDISIIDNFHIIIKYESLTDSPLETITKVAEKMSLDIIETRYKSNVTDMPYRKYVASSKNLKDYERIRKIIEQQDLTRTYEIYNKFLEKAI